jgi:hypothetical protein
MTLDDSIVSQLPDIALRAMSLEELHTHIRLVDRALHAAPSHSSKRQQLAAYLSQVRAVWRERIRVGKKFPGEDPGKAARGYAGRDKDPDPAREPCGSE